MKTNWGFAPMATRGTRQTSALLVALAAACALLGLSGCGGGSGAAASASVPTVAPLSAQAALGEKIFADVSLSASGKQSCATCHSPANAHAPANSMAAQLGGPLLSLQGNRSTPSIRYLSTDTAFHFDSEGTPTGGFFWDGRASSLRDQASHPLLAANEMANASAADVVAKLSRASYAAEFAAVFGADIFSRPDDAFERLKLALQQYQLEDTDFRPFSSKYDEFLRGKVALTDQEARGLALFNNPAKGNCIGCHPSGKAADGSFPLFTDFSFDNLGVPRNAALAQNDDPAFFDLGLCTQPAQAARADLCGAFKVPSLRNVAARHVFFHNGRFATLKDALTFYVQRDTNPEKWYPLAADGTVKKFDDLPVQYHANVNTSEVPYNRKLGDTPALSDAEIDDVIVFLKTLSDGFTP
ncbi:cytochrome c peroxidase [soil metagenome]